jgi:polysaccharide export outer membrane protein
MNTRTEALSPPNRLRIDRTRSWLVAAAACAALHFAPPALGQGTEYLIGVSDVLSLTVWQREEIGGSYTVDSEGNVTLPLIGAVRAAGVTASKLSEELTRRYSFIDREISQVTVAVAQYNSRRIFVMGEVQRPGAYAFPKVPGLWEVIREAGGPTAEASLGRVRVIPPEGEGSPQIIDLENVISTGDFSLLPELKPGTTILIPRAETIGPEGDVIYVYGSVENPGTFPIGAARTVLQAVIAAGGPRQDADVKSVRVVRPGPVQARVIEVNLQGYTHEGVLFSNVQLLPGDTVTVPRSQTNFIWRVTREALDAASSFLGTILFFTDWGNNNDDGTTVVVPAETQAAP